MKHCPVCNTQYDEEILRFCTKDGTPLVEEDKPNFIAMPSESLDSRVDDDFGEETVIRRNPSSSGTVPPPPPSIHSSDAPRIIIPTSDEPRPQQEVRSRPIPAYVAPPQRSNTGKVVIITILCTIVVLGGVAALVVLFRGDTNGNSNTNLNANLANQNTNVNTNLFGDSNFNNFSNVNFNAFTNVNFNFNTNSNVKTPTPTRTPTPSPSPTVSPSPSPSASPSSSPTPARTPSPRPSATPRFPLDPGPPRPSPTPRRTS